MACRKSESTSALEHHEDQATTIAKQADIIARLVDGINTTNGLGGLMDGLR